MNKMKEVFLCCISTSLLLSFGYLFACSFIVQQRKQQKLIRCAENIRNMGQNRVCDLEFLSRLNPCTHTHTSAREELPRDV